MNITYIHFFICEFNWESFILYYDVKLQQTWTNCNKIPTSISFIFKVLKKIYKNRWCFKDIKVGDTLSFGWSGMIDYRFLFHYYIVSRWFSHKMFAFDKVLKIHFIWSKKEKKKRFPLKSLTFVNAKNINLTFGWQFDFMNFITLMQSNPINCQSWSWYWYWSRPEIRWASHCNTMYLMLF